ncbi:MAG: hypothetical protein ACOC5T_06480 [Elusimicrobiota bacterium]
MSQKGSILEKFCSKLTEKEKSLLEDYINDPTFEVLSKTFDELVSKKEIKYEDTKDKS